MISTILFIFNCLLLCGEYITLYNIGWNPVLNEFKNLYWLLVSDIIIQTLMAIVLLLFIGWNMITCCLGNHNDSIKFSVMKSLVVFYFIGSSIYILYSYIKNYTELTVFNTFTNLLNIYFVGLLINILIFISYRIYKYYKKNNNQQTEYNLLEN